MVCPDLIKQLRVYGRPDGAGLGSLRVEWVRISGLVHVFNRHDDFNVELPVVWHVDDCYGAGCPLFLVRGATGQELGDRLQGPLGCGEADPLW